MHDSRTWRQRTGVKTLSHPPTLLFWYRQMGELWTLFEFACSLYLTCNMVLDMDGYISRVLVRTCIMIFSILRLYGMKFNIN